MDDTSVLELPGGNAAGPAEVAGGSIFFVGTATVILRWAGFTILTDPNFLHRGERVHLGWGMRSRRVTEPALDLTRLPPIDLALLSHLHEEHFDRLVQQKLDRALPILTTPEAARKLAQQGFRAAHGLATWETKLVRKAGARLRITATPAQHGRHAVSRLLPPVMGSIIDLLVAGGSVGYRIYISGDTTMHEALREIPRRYPAIDLALLHLGGTRILGAQLTMDARQGVEAVHLVQPDVAIPIHYNDYTVFKSPLADFMREVERAGLAPRVRYLKHGDLYGFDVPSLRAQGIPIPVQPETELRPS